MDALPHPIRAIADALALRGRTFEVVVGHVDRAQRAGVIARFTADPSHTAIVLGPDAIAGMGYPSSCCCEMPYAVLLRRDDVAALFEPDEDESDVVQDWLDVEAPERSRALRLVREITSVLAAEDKRYMVQDCPMDDVTLRQFVRAGNDLALIVVGRDMLDEACANLSKGRNVYDIAAIDALVCIGSKFFPVAPSKSSEWAQSLRRWLQAQTQCMPNYLAPPCRQFAGLVM